MAVQITESYDSTISEPLCDLCGKNSWTVRHRVDCEGDAIILNCAACDDGYVHISIGTQVSIL